MVNGNLKGRLAQRVDEALRASVRESEGFKKSPEFERLINILKGHERVNQVDLVYGTTNIAGITHDSFQELVEAVLLTEEWTRDPSSDFLAYHVDYEGVRFHIALGQGSTYWTTTKKQ